MKKMVLLKNGKYVPDIMVYGTLVDLRQVARDNPLAIFELVKLCKDREYKLPDEFLYTLGDPGLVVPDGIPQSDVKQIILSSVGGEGMEMVFRSPLHEREKDLEAELWPEDVYISSSEYWLEGWINE